MQKKGQLTIFIILGVLVLIVIGVLVFLTSTTITQGATQSVEEKKQELASFLQNCLEETAEKAVYLVGRGGGYINPSGSLKHGEPGTGIPSKAHIFLETGILPYLITEKEIFLRSKEELEKIISNYVAVELSNCLNVSRFEQQGFTIKKPEINFKEIDFDFSKAITEYASNKVSVSTIIRRNDVSIRINYPLLLERKSQRVLVEEAVATIHVRLGFIYDKVKQLLETALPLQFYEITSHCEEYASEDKLVNIYNYGDMFYKKFAIRFVDAKPLETGKMPFAFQFAVKNKEISGWCVG